jgi:predicted HTH transcriptional regulator
MLCLVMISESQVQALIAAGENRHMDFKTSIPRPSNLTHHIAGCANTIGGRILVGEGRTLEESIHDCWLLEITKT